MGCDSSRLAELRIQTTHLIDAKDLAAHIKAKEARPSTKGRKQAWTEKPGTQKVIQEKRRARTIPIKRIICVKDQLDCSESEQWELLSDSSCAGRDRQMIDGKVVPMAPSMRTHRNHQARFEQFLKRVTAKPILFKKHVALGRTLDAKTFEDPAVTGLATSILPHIPVKNSQSSIVMDWSKLATCDYETSLADRSNTSTNPCCP